MFIKLICGLVSASAIFSIVPHEVLGAEPPRENQNSWEVTSVSLATTQEEIKRDEPKGEENQAINHHPNPFAQVITRQIVIDVKDIVGKGDDPSHKRIRYFLIKGGFAHPRLMEDSKTKILNLTCYDEFKGSYTAFLYKVGLSPTVACNPGIRKLIIKGVTNHLDNGVEAIKLNFLRQQEDLKELTHSQDPYVPLLGLEVQSFWYQHPETLTIQHFQIIKRLPGNYFFLFRDEWMPEIYYKIGRGLGELNYRLASLEVKDEIGKLNFEAYLTKTHHDFHGKNILFHEKTRRVAFIDLETMADTFHKRVPFWHDIFTFYMREKYLDGNYRKYSEYNKWMNCFIRGYTDAHPLSIRQALKQEINHHIQSWSSIYKKTVYNKQFSSKSNLSTFNPEEISSYIGAYHAMSMDLTQDYIDKTLQDNFAADN